VSIEILDNGIKPITVYAGAHGDYPAGELRVGRILKWLESEGDKISRDKSQKRHVRFIAKQAFLHAVMARARLRQIVHLRKRKQMKAKPRVMYAVLYETIEIGFLAGYWYQRLEVEQAEPDAARGMKSHLASMRKRKPRSGSVRDRFHVIYKNGDTTAEIIRKLHPFFPQMEKLNLKRQIQRFRNQDTKP
jgi:hypothetical protein